MITNDRQYKIVKAQIENFQHSLTTLNAGLITANNVHPKLIEAQKNAIKSQLSELEFEVTEYENLKEGKIAIAEVKSLKDLPLTLIKARIANGLTQAELAEKIGVKMQQVQRYEAEKYESASIKTLLKVAEKLKIKFNGEVQIKTVKSPENFDVNNYPFKQMYQRKWFGNFSGTYNEAVIDSRNLLEKFFERVGFNNSQLRFTKKSIRTGSTLNMFALNAWYGQVLSKAQDQHVEYVFEKHIITSTWLRALSELSMQEDGPKKASEYLKAAGIRFIIEPQLEGTFLDGAALLMEDNSPVIAMTLRYDRLDNFWFVLFHEIAHVLLHLSESLSVIFDDLDVKLDGIEKEADDFALNSLIPDRVWKTSLVRFSPSPASIINQAKTLKVHPALVAGRIRRETGSYYKFSDLIGQGEVRKLFLQELKN